MLFRRLDTFADDPQLEQVRQFDDLGDDGVAGLVVTKVRNKALVDFDVVDWELLEVGERGIASAEIVKGEANS